MTRMMLAALALLAGWATAADAGCFCRSCGGGNCSKVCRLVPDVTKVTTYEYCLVCEDFCLHGHSKCVGCKKVCDCQGCCKCEKVMQPTCCGIRTKAKLMKIPVVEEKHGWKCVVVSRCRVGESRTRSESAGALRLARSCSSVNRRWNRGAQVHARRPWSGLEAPTESACIWDLRSGVPFSIHCAAPRSWHYAVMRRKP